jgi:hypothetical protein
MELTFSQLLNFAGNVRPFIASTQLPLFKSYVRHILTHLLGLILSLAWKSPFASCYLCYPGTGESFPTHILLFITSDYCILDLICKDQHSVDDHASMRRPRTKRQQIMNTSGTNGRKQRPEIEGYPIAIFITSTIPSSQSYLFYLIISIELLIVDRLICNYWQLLCSASILFFPYMILFMGWLSTIILTSGTPETQSVQTCLSSLRTDTVRLRV